jgi:hypothetical protein
MRHIRKRLYHAAERLDEFLDGLLKRISPGTRTVLLFIIGVLAAAAAWTGKYLLACVLLGCGAALWLGR